MVSAFQFIPNASIPFMLPNGKTNPVWWRWFKDISLSGTGFLVDINNLSDVANTTTARNNLGAAPTAGSTSIVTLGTVTTGTWNASVVQPTYGGTGVNNGTSTVTLSSNFVLSGAGNCTLVISGSTNVTLPTTGTLITSSVTTLSSLVSIGTIGTGVWQGTKIGLAYGGTNADLSATGGTSQVLRQSSSGAAITVSQLAESELSFTDITTNNSSTSKHGFLKKLSNSATEFMNGQGNWTTPSSTSTELSFVVNGRLTLTSGTAVTTSDVTAATTLYFTPYAGSYISLYDGVSTWTTINFTEISIAVPATTSTMYDVFCYDSSGTATLELTAWTNDTTRATALTLQNGVLVKTGDTTRRYLGCMRTTGSSGQTEDSLAKRYVWNYYNRIARPMKVVDTTDSWNYSTASFRQANNAATNQLDFIVGYREDTIEANVTSLQLNSTGTVRQCIAGIGLDSTTVNSANLSTYGSSSSSFIGTALSYYSSTIAVGRHTLVWLEYGAGADTQTWFGDAGSVVQSGIQGVIFG